MVLCPPHRTIAFNDSEIKFYSIATRQRLDDANNSQRILNFVLHWKLRDIQLHLEMYTFNIVYCYFTEKWELQKTYPFPWNSDL